MSAVNPAINVLSHTCSTNSDNPVTVDNSIQKITVDCLNENINLDDCSHKNSNSVEYDNNSEYSNIKKTNDYCDQSGESLQPLAGVFLPKNLKHWSEMNAYFHSSNLFRFANGKIDDLDSAAAEFNNSIYGYLTKRHSMLKGTKKM